MPRFEILLFKTFSQWTSNKDKLELHGELVHEVLVKPPYLNSG